MSLREALGSRWRTAAGLSNCPKPDQESPPILRRDTATSAVAVGRQNPCGRSVDDVVELLVAVPVPDPVVGALLKLAEVVAAALVVEDMAWLAVRHALTTPLAGLLLAAEPPAGEAPALLLLRELEGGV